MTVNIRALSRILCKADATRTMIRRSARLVSTAATYATASTSSKIHVNETTRRIGNPVVQATDCSDSGIRLDANEGVGPTSRKTKRSRVEKDSSISKAETDELHIPAVKRRRKDHLPSPELVDFPSRTTTPWKIGPHVSSAGGVENAIANAASVGWAPYPISSQNIVELISLHARATAFALFLKSQRKWESKAITEISAEKFKKRLRTLGYSPGCVLPHGNYLVNLGNPDA